MFSKFRHQRQYRFVASNFKMTHRLYIIILTIAFCFTNAFTSCGHTQNKKAGQISKSKSTNNIQLDTSKTAIILFVKKLYYPFDSSLKPPTLTQEDIVNIDSLLIACVNDYNDSLDKDHKQRSIDLKKRNYKKQLMVVANKKGEKEVWVNCFCSTSTTDGRQNL